MDATVAAEEPIELWISRVHVEHGRIELEELVQAGDHLDVVGADAAQHGRADLLLALVDGEPALTASNPARKGNEPR